MNFAKHWLSLDSVAGGSTIGISCIGDADLPTIKCRIMLLYVRYRVEPYNVSKKVFWLVYNIFFKH